VSRRALVLGTVIACFALPALAVIVGAALHHSATRKTGTLTSGGMERDYIVHVPPGYDPSKPTPLVLSLHGGKNNPALQMVVSQWNRVADRHGFIVAYPAGQQGALKVWAMQGDRNPSRMPDVVFISELLDKLQATYNIDPARIYANGLSNGAGMTFVLSCTLSHRIAAVGMVSAAYFQPFAWCRDTTPVPMIAIHGAADRLTRLHGGPHWIAGRHSFPSIPKWTARWARRNSCGAAPVETTVAPDVTRLEYPACANDAAVVLYTLRDGGHTWPGGTEVPEWLLGPTPRSLDASETMWAFFQAHPLRRAP
jgi:polyhydroxybutyrate depolymerase